MMTLRRGTVHVLVQLSTILVVAPQAQEGENALEFGILCGLTKTAEAIGTLDEREYLKELTNWQELADMETDLTVIYNGLNETGTSSIRGKPGDIGIQISNKAARTRVLATLDTIRARLKNAKELTEKEKTCVKQNLKEAKEAALRAVAGGAQHLNDGLASVASALGSVNRGSKACLIGASGTAGSSLAHDMLCLCAAQSANEKHCGFDAGSHTWSGASFGTQTSAVSGIKQACEQLKLEVHKTPQGIGDWISRFYQVLGRQSSGLNSDVKTAPWYLGKPANNGACDGTAAKGKCVSYASDQGSTTRSMGTVKWLNELKQAKSLLEKNEQIARAVNKTIQKGENLMAIAETILVQANASRDDGHESVQDPSRPKLAAEQPQPAAESVTRSNQVVNSISSARFVNGWYVFWLLLF